MSSLQDQLLKAGLIDAKKAKQTKKEKAKQAKGQRKSAQPHIDETKEAAKRALAEKAERDRQLNAERDALAQQKAIQAQIKQLISLNKLPKDGDIAYNFKDGTTIKKVHVSQKLVDQLSRGQLAIAKLDNGYEVVPAVVAEKIAMRDASFVVAQVVKTAEVEAENDPYADYAIPDDLMW